MSSHEKLFFKAVTNFTKQHYIFWCWWRWWRIHRSDSIDHFHHLEDDKRQENEIDGNGDEIAIGKNGYASLFERIKGPRYTFWDISKDQKQVSKVDMTPQKSGNNRHDDVVDQGIHDFSEGPANNDADR